MNELPLVAKVNHNIRLTAINATLVVRQEDRRNRALSIQALAHEFREQCEEHAANG